MKHSPSQRVQFQEKPIFHSNIFLGRATLLMQWIGLHFAKPFLPISGTDEMDFSLTRAQSATAFCDGAARAKMLWCARLTAQISLQRQQNGPGYWSRGVFFSSYFGWALKKVWRCWIVERCTRRRKLQRSILNLIPYVHDIFWNLPHVCPDSCCSLMSHGHAGLFWDLIDPHTLYTFPWHEWKYFDLLRKHE